MAEASRQRRRNRKRKPSLVSCDGAAAYVPTLEEISQATAELRAGWSDEESAKRLRADWRAQQFDLPAWSVPGIETKDEIQ